MQNQPAFRNGRKILAIAALASVLCLGLNSVQAQTTTTEQAHTIISTSVGTTETESQPLILDVPEINDELVADSAAVDGLRQKVLLNQPDVTVVLLSFEKDGTKSNHIAPGTATITVLKGAVNFEVLGKQHQLSERQVIVLPPNVMHNLKATEKSLVLVTISKNAAAPTGHAD